MTVTFLNFFLYVAIKAVEHIHIGVAEYIHTYINSSFWGCYD